jgi:ligand-binding sensor domain-containing protein/AraC-like DNA-binding protein
MQSDGLPQSTVYAVLRAADGFLWVGTDGGLARFDGLSFTSFQRGESSGALARPVISLLQSGDGTLWIATYGGGLVRGVRGTFRRFGKKEGLASEAVWCLAADRSGAVWAGTIGGGLVCCRDGAIRLVRTGQGLPGETVLSVAPAADGGLWAGTDRGLARVEGEKARPVPIPGAGRAPRVTALRDDGHGSLWVGTTDGLFLCRNGSWRRFDHRHGLPGPFIRSLAVDPSGRLWLGCDAGLARLEADGRFSASTVADGLSDSTVLAVHADSEDNLWLGTGGGGLMRLRQGPARVWGERQGAPGGQALALCQDKAGTFWLSSYGTGLVRLNGGRIERPAILQKLAQKSIYSLLPFPGGLWIGTQSGLLRLEGNIPLRAVTGLPRSPVAALLERPDHSLLIGTTGDGLFRIQAARAQPVAAPPGLDNASVQALVCDKRGAVWVGTFGNGLYRWDDERWRHYDAGDGLPGASVFALRSDSRGELWIGCDDGLARFDGKALHAYGAAAGLPAGTVYSILEAKGHLWLGSHRGIWAVSQSELDDLDRGRRQSLHPLCLDETDGLPSAVCNGGFQPAAWTGRDGQLWFSTMRGAVAVDPQRALETTDPPLLHIETLLADRRVLGASDGMEVPAGTRRIELRFSAPEMVKPQDLRFRCRLEGSDDAWVELGPRRAMSYENLPPGRYRFRVVCRRGGKRSEAALAFHLLPRFHQTWLFRLGAALALLAAALFVRQTVIRRRRAARYRLSTLTSPQARHLEIRLLKLMADEKPHLDPDLTLAGLAERLGVPPKHLSQVINDRIGLNFSDFVNRQRVEEARRRLLDPAQRDQKLLAIAFSCGFNSKSVFNAAFKKFTGLSPTEFRDGARSQ